MKKILLVAAGLCLLAGGGVAVWLLRRPAAPQHPPRDRSAHGTGIDRSMIAVLALYRASDGKTPCESAYIAFKNSQDIAEMYQAKEVILELAPKDQFMEKCQQLTPAEQQCVWPRYRLAHRDECKTIRPGPEKLKPMVTELQNSAGGNTNPMDPSIMNGTLPPPH
jgi:hypothetical protein